MKLIDTLPDSDLIEIIRDLGQMEWRGSEESHACKIRAVLYGLQTYAPVQQEMELEDES